MRHDLTTALGFLTLAVLAAPLPAQASATAEATELAVETFDRAWELIRDTHFDPELGGLDWDAVREELRPQAATATSRNELRRIISDMLGRLGLSHFELIPEESVDALQSDGDEDEDDESSAGEPGDDEAEDDDSAGSDEEGDLGLDVRRIDGAILVVQVEDGSPAAAAGIRPGWEVLEVGKRVVADLLERIPSDLEPRLADFYAAAMVRRRLEGDAGSTVRVVCRDGQDETVELELRRRVKPGQTVQFGNLPAVAARLTRAWLPAGEGEPRIGTFAFNIWMVPLMQQINASVEEFRDADGIILDLRGNPGGIGGMGMGVAGHFIDEPVALGTMTTRQNQLNFTVAPQRVNARGQRVTPFDGPLAILVDGTTGSTSEIFAAGLQFHGRARVFGQTSIGAALPAMMDRLPNGDVLLHAVADYVLPDGTRVEGRGVVPDTPVPLSREALLRDPDPVMTAAREWIQSETIRQNDAPEED